MATVQINCSPQFGFLYISTLPDPSPVRPISFPPQFIFTVSDNSKFIPVTKVYIFIVNWIFKLLFE